MDVPYLQARIEWETTVDKLTERVRVEEISGRNVKSRPSDIVRVRATGPRELNEKIQSLLGEQRSGGNLAKIQFSIPEEHQDWRSREIRREITSLPYIDSELEFSRVSSEEGWNYEGTYRVLEQLADEREIEKR